MAYTLIGSQRSPFVRICRLLMIHHQIPFEFQLLNFVEDTADAERLSKQTPINKVPILIEGDQKIFDSRVIVNYLLQKHRLAPLSLEEENWVSCVYSCMDAGVILFLMRRDGYDLNSSGFFLSRQKQRLPDNLNYLKSWATSLDPARSCDWNYGSMSLFSFLYWAQARELLDLSLYAEMSDFMERFQNQPGVRETSF